jgi:Glycosyl transferase family 41
MLFVFCCFNNPYKITPDLFDVWKQLLGRVEGSVLWLLQHAELTRRSPYRGRLCRDVGAGATRRSAGDLCRRNDRGVTAGTDQRPSRRLRDTDNVPRVFVGWAFTVREAREL